MHLVCLLLSLLLCSTPAITIEHGATFGNINAGYVPGIGGMPPINEANCLTSPVFSDPSLSNALECARACVAGEKPKICYYNFNLERYPVNGIACSVCSPNIANSICPNCQCVPGDGVDRMALTVNRMLPGPSIQVCKGDHIVVDVNNGIDGESVTIHWHGMHQNGSQYYDGVPFLTQCPIYSANTFRYQFTANNCGTHFWHAHTALHKTDGIFGSFIVREPPRDDPNSCLYENDLASHVIIVNDWMHDSAVDRFPGRNAGVTGQNPDSFLINGRGKTTKIDGNKTNIDLKVFTVEPNQRYRFRFINSFCTRCGAYLTVEGHTLTVIGMDGEKVVPTVVNTLSTFAGERYDFIINANQSSGAYWIQLRGILQCSNLQQLAILRYAGESAIPDTPEPGNPLGLPLGNILNPPTGGCKNLKNAMCISDLRNIETVDQQILTEEPDIRLFFKIGLQTYSAQTVSIPNKYPIFIVPAPGAVSATTVNNILTTNLPVPPLSQPDDVPAEKICSQQNWPSYCEANFCECTQVIDIKLDDVVEIVVVDSFGAENMAHPFHLHGYHYSIIGIGQPLGPYQRNQSNLFTVEMFQELDKNKQIERNYVSPPHKDTVLVQNNGYAVFRFRASNPGRSSTAAMQLKFVVDIIGRNAMNFFKRFIEQTKICYWAFHCHILYHVATGMQLVLHVGEQKDLPPVPRKFPKCGNFVPQIKFKTN